MDKKITKIENLHVPGFGIRAKLSYVNKCFFCLIAREMLEKRIHTLPIASKGMTDNLFEVGKTYFNQSKIVPSLKETSTSNINKNISDAELIWFAKVIILDEATLAHGRYCFICSWLNTKRNYEKSGTVWW